MRRPPRSEKKITVSKSDLGPNSIAKLGVVLEESDETAFWLELLADAEIMRQEQLEHLIKENSELTSIFVSSIRTAKGIAR